MRNLLIHVWSKQNKTAIACLILVPLVISCAAADVSEPPSDTGASSTSEETVVAENPITPQSAQTPSEPAASGSSQPAPAADNQLINLKSGMQYADARARLLEQGWVPAAAPEPSTYGVERMA